MSTSLFLVNTLSIGGSERKVVRLLNRLQERDVPVHVGYLNSPDSLLAELRDDLPRICFGRKGPYDPRVLAHLWRYVKAHSVRNIVPVNLYPTLYAVPLRSMAAHGRLRVAALVNTTDFRNRGEERRMILYRPILKRADRIVFGCRHQRDVWVNRYGLDPANCCHIYNGVDTRHFSIDYSPDARERMRTQLRLATNETLIGTVGQLRPEKNHYELITATKKLREQGLPVRAVIVGEGPLRAGLEAQIAALGLEKSVVLAGETRDVRQFLAAIDVFVNTSTAIETFSNAALEAMSMGCPVVLTRIGGAAEMVTESENGYLYPPQDESRLVELIAGLVRDEALRKSLGKRARCAVEQNFSFEHMVDEYLDKILNHGSTVTPVKTHWSMVR